MKHHKRKPAQATMKMVQEKIVSNVEKSAVLITALSLFQVEQGM